MTDPIRLPSAIQQSRIAVKLCNMLLGARTAGPFRERGFPAIVDSPNAFPHFADVFRHTEPGVEKVGEAFCTPYDEGRLICAVMVDAETMRAAAKPGWSAFCQLQRLPLPWAPGAWVYRVTCTLDERDRPIDETAQALRDGRRIWREDSEGGEGAAAEEITR